MSFTLREEQLLCISEAGKALAQDRRTILCLGTGGGKTFCASEITRRSLQKGRRVFILVYREEILWQFLETLIKFGIQPSLIHAGQKFLGGQQIYLGMVETFKRRKLASLLEPGDLVIIDEAHRGEYEALVKTCPSYCLGLTATPKASGTTPLNAHWGNCIMPVKLSWMLQNNRLVPATTYSVQHDFSNLKVRGRDYDEALLIQEFRKPTLFEGAVDQYEKHAQGLQAICYSVNVEMSLDLCRLFNERGYRACHVDGTTQRGLRKDYMRGYRDRKIQILCNVGVATTGFDDPGTECIIKSYATVQLSKDKQCDGRGARTYPGKERFIIIDMGRNYIRHGKFGEDIDWIAIFNNPLLERKTRPKEKDKDCKECGALINVLLSACPYCGATYSTREIEERILELGDTVEIKEYKLSKLPPHMRDKKVTQMDYRELQIYAEAMGHDKKWANIRWAMKNKARKRYGNQGNK